MIARADIDICNMALQYAGANQKIGSLTESKEAAKACNVVYAEIRRQILSEFRWPFATKRQQLMPYAGNAYDAAHDYLKGDLAEFGPNVYRALQGDAATVHNLNKQPDLDSSAAWWAQVTRDGYAYACPLPDDCIDPIQVWEKISVSGTQTAPSFVFQTKFDPENLRNPRSDERPAFKLENANDGTDQTLLLTDVDTPILMYYADIANPSAFPPMFVETFAWHIAAVLAMSLRGDEKKAAACRAMAERTLADAFVVTNRDQQGDPEPVSEFEAARES